MSRRAAVKVSMAPLAITSDGDLLLNVAMTDGPDDPRQLVERALAQGTPIFVGVVATAREVATAKAWMDDASAEVVGAIWGGRGRRRVGRSRK